MTISQMKYDDLFSVPYKKGGRDVKTGLDCYGFLQEICKRNGTPLNDFDNLNLLEISEEDAKKGDIVQCFHENVLHVAFMLDKNSVIHCTQDGVKVSPMTLLNNKKYFRIINYGCKN